MPQPSVHTRRQETRILAGILRAPARTVSERVARREIPANVISVDFVSTSALGKLRRHEIRPLILDSLEKPATGR